VANYFAGALTGSFEKQIQDLLRLERVWIDPLLVQGIDPTARVTLGKEVADDLFLVYSFDVGGPTAGQQYRLYQVEWQANRKIRVVVGNSTVGGVSGDVRYTTRFMGRRGKHEPAGVPAVPEPEIHDPAFRPHEGEPVLSVVVQVPRDEGQRQIEDDLPLKAGDVYRRSALFEGAHRIRRRFVRQDRIEARVLAEAVRQDSEESGVHVRYEVDPGPSVKIETEGVEKKKDRRRIRERLEQLWIDSIFQEEIYQDAVEVIVEYFHERGYYAADAVYEESMTDDVRTVRFVVDTGEPVKVQSVEIRGADNLSEEQIQRQMLTRPATAFARRLLVPGELRDDVAAIVNLYRDHGYLAVRVEPPQIRLSATGWSARIVLTIDEGPNYKVAEISVPPDLPFSAELIRQWIELDPGDVFSPRKLIEAEGALRAQLDRQGYPNARVGSRVAIDNGEVRVGFEVSLGEIQRLGDVRIEGARATKPRVIQREVNDHIQTGDLISRNALLEIQHRLYRLGIFRSVRLSLEPMEGDATLQTLVIQVQESPPIGLMVGGGYDTEGGIGGVFSISHANPGGRNRTVAFQGRANSIEQSLQLALDDPRFLGKRYTSLTNLLWKKREGRAFTEDRRIFSFRVERTPKPKLLEFVRYSFQKVDLSDVTDEQAAREEKLEDLTLGSVTYGRAWTTRRDLFVATDGTLASGEVSLFAKAIGSDAQFWKIYLQGTKDFPIRRRQTFATAARLGLEFPYGVTTRVPLAERFFAGGSQTIRGFELDEAGPVDENGDPLGGEALLILNQEYRFPIWGPVRGVLFYDLGTVWATVDSIDLSELRHVLGTGVRLETPIGPIRFEYGWKVDRREGESPGAFYFSIGSLF
jgi:outer membrane protein insertion porin family